MSISIYSLFILGATFTCFLTPFFRYIALKKGFVDCPQRARKVHYLATPRLGGAAILLSFLAVSAIAGLSVPQFEEMLWGANPIIGFIIMGSIGIFVIGFLDDLARLSPKTKLLGEFVIAGLIVFYSNLTFTELKFLGFGSILIPEFVGFTLSCMWIVGMTNSINLIDGLDGLASGITLLGLLAVSIVGYLVGILSVTWITTLLIGCLLGFLVFNSRPASIFLGDCGSLTLGFLAGCFSLLASFREGGALDGIFPVLAFAVPILDCVFAIFRRLMRGRSPFSPDMEHFHHRLMAKGLSHGKAVLVMWSASFSCSLVSIAAAFRKGDQLFAVLVFFGMGGFILLRYLGYFRFEFFGQSLSSLMEDRRSTQTAEQSIKDAELMLQESNDLQNLHKVLEKAAEGMQFQEATISFYEENGRLGTKLESGNNNIIGKEVSWKDPNYSGYYSRDSEFIVEFPISGRQFAYGNILYRFIDNRNKLEVHEEVLLERIHDALYVFAAKLRKQTKN